MSPIRKVIKLLTPKEKRRLALISGAFCVMALLQVLGVGSIGPFMSVAAEPESIESSRYLSGVYEALGFESTRGFLLFLGGVVLVLVVGGNAFTTFSLYHGYRFVGMLRYSLGLRLFRRYLYQLINGMLFRAMEAFARGAWKGGSLPLASYRPRPAGRGTGAALSGSARRSAGPRLRYCATPSTGCGAAVRL